jgi:hypothetical protein
MLELGDSIFFSTILAPGTAKEFDEWWYRAPLSGQHIAFYTLDSLKTIAKKFDKKLYSNGTNFHILSNVAIDENKWKEIFFPVKKSRMQRIIKRLSGGQQLLKRKSLAESDFKMIEEIVLKSTK